MPTPTISSLLYQYIVGGVLFVIGMIFVFKSDVVDLKLRRYRIMVIWLIAGYFIYLAIHSFFFFVAPRL